MADGVARAFEIAGGPDDGPIIALENSAGSGETLGTTIEEMAGILDAVADRGVPKDRVAICLDAAHLWAAGYAIADAEGVERVVEEVDRRIGLARVAMIHFNDSRAALGSNLDRHQHVGAGSIGPAGMGALIRHPRLRHVTYYLETPGMDEGYDAINAARARDLLAGLPLADLPKAALTLRGSRARIHPPIFSISNAKTGAAIHKSRSTRGLRSSISGVRRRRFIRRSGDFFSNGSVRARRVWSRSIRTPSPNSSPGSRFANLNESVI